MFLRSSIYAVRYLRCVAKFRLTVCHSGILTLPHCWNREVGQQSAWISTIRLQKAIKGQIQDLKESRNPIRNPRNLWQNLEESQESWRNFVRFRESWNLVRYFEEWFAPRLILKFCKDSSPMLTFGPLARILFFSRKIHRKSIKLP